MSTKSLNAAKEQGKGSVGYQSEGAGKTLASAMEAGVKVKMPANLLGHVTRAQNTLDDLRKTGGVEGVVRSALRKFEEELSKLQIACDSICPIDDEQKLAKEAWIERNVRSKEKYLAALKSVLEDEAPRLQLNDQDLGQEEDQESLKSAIGSHGSRSSRASSVSRLARAEAAANTRALELEVEHRRRQRQLQEQERQLRLQREDEELNLKLRQARVREEALASEGGSLRARSLLEVPVEPGPSNVIAPSYLPPVATWAPRSNQALPGPACAQPEAMQNEERLLQQVLLPQSKLPVFKGDELEFMWFMRAFEMRVEGVTRDPARRLYLLLQHLEGDARTLVMGCQLLEDPAHGYARAKEKLTQRYGNKIRQALAFKAKLLAWPTLKKDSVTDLDKFSIQLQLCEEVRLTGGLAELDAGGTILQLMRKLPHKLQESWQMRAYRIEIKQDREANFEDFSRFVTEVAAARNHPVYGNRTEAPPAEIRKGAKALATVTEEAETFSAKSVEATTAATATGAPRSSTKGPVTAETAKNAFQSPCLFCEGMHAAHKCRTAAQLPIRERRSKLGELCFGCLHEGHTARQCPKKATCSKCQGTHPTVLHFERGNSTEEEGNTDHGTRNTDDHQAATTCATSHSTRIAVAVVPVWVWTVGSRPRVVQAILDPGSTATFMTKDLAKQLNLHPEEGKLQLTTMTSENEPVAVQVASGIKVSGLDRNETITLPPTYTVTRMPFNGDDLAKEEDVLGWDHLSSIPFNWSDAHVQLLIGMNAPEALKPREVAGGQSNEPYAVRTVLGWCLNGPLPGRRQEKALVNLTRAKEVTQWLERLHTTDFDSAYDFDTKGPSQEDSKWLDKVQQSIHRQARNGQYEIALPFRQAVPPLANNRVQAAQRLSSLKRKLETNMQFKLDYTTFMAKMEEQHYVEEVEPDSGRGVVSYVPHHGVYHPRKPGKLRVVFNCSNKYNGISLNDCLIPGPDLTNSLLGVLLRFRQEPVAFMADIESMFYRVQVPEHDRDVLRYLWWPGGDVTKTPKTYRMRVHLFGAASSPSCANFALRQAAEDAWKEGQVSEEVRDAVKNNFYVDDCLKSMPTDKAARQMADGLVKACRFGGFNLTKFISNNVEVLKSLPNEALGKSLSEVDLRDDKRNPLGALQERALGVSWSVATDVFRISAGAEQLRPTERITKRSVLRILSAIYDPMGMAAPVIVIARILFRDLTKERSIEWDDSLEAFPEALRQWREWCEALTHLDAVEVPRCFRATCDATSKLTNGEWQLHVFCDASEDAYAAVAYLRQKSGCDQKPHVAFVVGKARVSPPKIVTIPRLELTAAKLATEVINMVQRELPHYGINRRVLWTDSQTVLKYLNNQVRRFHTFVANRIAAILTTTTVEEWRYVPTGQNPADQGSRGIRATELNNSTWLRGPEFLWKDEEHWPKQENTQLVDGSDPEVHTLAIKDTARSQEWIETLARRHSTFYGLKKAVQVWKEFLLYLTTKQKPSRPSDWMRAAETSILRSMQRTQWAHELDCLAKEKPVRKDSSIYKLGPEIDNEGLIVIGSRIRAQLPILSGNSVVAELIVKEAHAHTAHMGRQATANRVLQAYWVTGLNKVVRKVVRECPGCQKRHAQPKTRQMGALPEYRIEASKAFETTGVDYFGPFHMKRARSQVKMYGVIFTCAVTRAIHLEASEDLSGSAFINALRRFVARRGHARRLVSDNGTNFVGAQSALTHELKRELHQLQDSSVKEWLAQRAIEWVFNPPGGSHHGGFWERMIRTIRGTLDALLPTQRPLTYDGIATVLCEVEAVLNNRPLTHVSEDPNDYEALTPNHLLLGTAGPVAPPGDYRRVSVPLKKQWRQVQHVANCFWRRWTTEYKTLLHQRSRWHEDQGRALEVHDVVLVIDAIRPREYWALGRVTATHPGKDGKVRVVTVTTAKGVFRRPITKVCLLEAASESHKNHATSSR